MPLWQVHRHHWNYNEKMLALHPNRVNPGSLWAAAKAVKPPQEIHAVSVRSLTDPAISLSS